jgi:hypothetical protein
LTSQKQNVWQFANVNICASATAGAFSFPGFLQIPMSLNLDTEIVATAYDPATETCTYTIARNGQRWTVRVPMAQLEGHGANKEARRAHLANLLTAAMQGLPDDASDPGQGPQGEVDA